MTAEVAERWAMMQAWGDKHLSGRRLEYFRSFCERERSARMHGCTLLRAKGTVDPWNMSTPDDIAESVFYYQVPLQKAEDRQWDAICEAMLNDQRLTPALAQAMLDNAKVMKSATPKRLARLRGAFNHRFGARSVASQEQWMRAASDELDGTFEDN